MSGTRHSIRWIALGILVLTSFAPTAGAAQAGGPTPAPVGLNGDVFLVTFQPGTPAAERAAAVAQSGAIVRRDFSTLNVVSVRIPNEAALAQLRAQGRVLSVVANQPVTLEVAPVVLAQGGGGRGGGGGGGGTDGGGSGKKPRAPTNLVADAVSFELISLSWGDASNDETGFAIERCAGTACDNFLPIGNAPTDATSFDDDSVVGGTVYRYIVFARNGSASSKPSNVAEATTPPDGGSETAPSDPTNLTANAPDDTRVDLTWIDTSNNEDGFTVERCLGSVPCGFGVIATLAPNAAAHSDLTVADGTTYTYRVSAFNGALSSGYSNTSQVTVPPSNGGGGGGSQSVPAGVSRIGAAPGDLNVTGSGVGVAIVDTGLDFLHADLAPAPESFSFAHASCQDPHSHGTHVGGIVAALDNDIDVVGVAPDATLYCVDVFMEDPLYGAVASDESIVAGLDWILSNADVVDPPIRVVNMSLGRPRTVDDGPTHPFGIALEALHSAGISIVVAAGNDPSLEVTDRVPASYPQSIAVASINAADGQNGSVNFPTPCPGELPASADSASYFSTDGAFAGGVGVTISAPGALREDIGMFLDFVCVIDEPAVGILSTKLGGGTIRYSGTSMAAPHVAGVIALMWEYEMGLGAILGPEDARSRIRSHADRIGTAPLDSPVDTYSFDGEREGILWAPGAILGGP